MEEKKREEEAGGVGRMYELRGRLSTGAVVSIPHAFYLFLTLGFSSAILESQRIPHTRLDPLCHHKLQTSNASLYGVAGCDAVGGVGDLDWLIDKYTTVVTPHSERYEKRPRY